MPKAKHVMTKSEFDCLSARQKGYVVYMVGARNDQPHVPETYVPCGNDADEYGAGQSDAVLEVQDCP